MTSEDVLAKAAAAVLDGTPVDWDALESSVDEADRHVVRQLRVLAELGTVHRNAPDPAGSTPAATLTPTSTPTLASTVTAPDPRAATRRALAAWPATWGPLELLERIGQGAFGQVFRAWDTRLDRQVALKLLEAASPQDARAGTIIQEGRLIARVRHPNVATVYGADRLDGQVGVWISSSTRPR